MLASDKDSDENSECTSVDLNDIWEDLTTMVGHNDPYVIASKRVSILNLMLPLPNSLYH
jgi:hypothetical protein